MIITFVPKSGAFLDAVVLLVADKIVSYSQTCFYIPMIIQHPVISGTDTSACQPSFISVLFQPGEYTERQFFPSDIELCPIEVSTPEKAVKLLASPVFIFWLYQPIAVHIFLFPYPWTQTAGQFNCAFISDGI